jgi:hypothetical protein
MSQMREDEEAVRPPLDLLKALLDAGAMRLGVHIRKMNSPGSPVYRYGENLWPAASILVGSFALTVLTHFYVGGAVLAVGCAWWIMKVQPRIRDGVFDRTSAWVLQSEQHFDALWAKGVLSLYVELPDGRKLAATRRDDWRAFVRQVTRERAATAAPAPTAEAA